MKTFAIFYGATVGLALLYIAWPEAVLFLALPTLGLALPPILLSPALALYLTGLWPAVIAGHAGLSRRGAIGLGFLSILAVAIGPGLLARQIVRRDAGPIIAQDRVGHLDSPPRRIEFEYPATDDGWPLDPLRTAPCDALCQTLLLDREVDEVRINAVSSGTIRAARVVYAYQELATCPRAYAEARAILPATREAASRGRCIVATVDGNWTPHVKLVVARLPKGWISSHPFLHDTGKLTLYDVVVLEAGQWRLVSRATELRTAVILMPLLVGLWVPPMFDYRVSSALKLVLQWARVPFVINPMDVTAVARASLGYRAEMPGEPALHR